MAGKYCPGDYVRVQRSASLRKNVCLVKNKASILKGKQWVVKALRTNFGYAKILLSNTGPLSLHAHTRLRLPVQDGDCKCFCHDKP
jgi:hypothetical protein